MGPKTISQQLEDELGEYITSVERIGDVGCGACREGHKQTLHEEQVPVRNRNDAILSDELNDETAKNGSLKREGHRNTKTSCVMKILQCSWTKPSCNYIP